MARRIDVYRGFGLALLVLGGISSLSTYLVVGLAPLVALFIGIAVVGASMFLTPAEVSRRPKELLAVITGLLGSVSSLLEALRMGSEVVFAPYGGDVYIYISSTPLQEIPREPLRSLVTAVGGGYVLSMLSPIKGGLVEGFGDPCSAIDHLAVEVLDIADSISECAYDGKRLAVRFSGASLSEPQRLGDVLGGIYGIIVGSIAALYMGSARLEARGGDRGSRIIVVSRVG